MTKSETADFPVLAGQYSRSMGLCGDLTRQTRFLDCRIAQLSAAPDSHARAMVPMLRRQRRLLLAQLLREQERLENAAAALEAEIAKLQNERLALLLRCRYLELLGWEDVAERMGLGSRWVQRLHKRALGRLGETALIPPKSL